MNYKNVDVEITKKGKRKSKQADGKVSCTFHLPFDVRDDLQALAFMTKKAYAESKASAKKAGASGFMSYRDWKKKVEP
tara:strand:- start:514 stop:747 length:234 start_codon:yes stop_codon:yes gene_type:complete